MSEAARWLSALLLVITANVAAWCAGRFLPASWARPIDGGLTLADGNRLLGNHKTWAGFFIAVAVCSLVATLMRLSPAVGAGFGALSMLGDCASSLIKRRLRFRPGREIPLLDQLPEALVPLVALSQPLQLPLYDAVAIAFLFLILDLAVLGFRHPDLHSESGT
jgi:CDP-2,3-bis-(O-geranylgeranyl)-sn-glycerol synthase